MEAESAASQLVEPSPEDETTPETTPTKRVWGFWPTVGFSLAIGFIILMAQLVLLLGLMFSNLDAATLLDPLAIEEYFYANLGLIMGLATLISGVLGIAGIIGLIKIRKGASITEYLGLRRVSFKTLALLLLISLAIIAAIEGLGILFNQTVETDFDTQMYRTSGWPVLLWLAVVVLAPLQEEVFFRGFLFAGLRDSRFGVAGAVVVTSLLWAGLHTQYNLYVMGNIFVMGLVLGFVRHKTKSLWSTLFIHAVYNLVAMLLIALNAEGIFG